VYFFIESMNLFLVLYALCIIDDMEKLVSSDQQMLIFFLLII